MGENKAEEFSSTAALLRPESGRRGFAKSSIRRPTSHPCAPRVDRRIRGCRNRVGVSGPGRPAYGAHTTGGFGGPPLWHRVATHLRCGRHHGTQSLARTHCREPMKHSATHWRHCGGPIGALSGRTHTFQYREPHDTRKQPPQLMGRPCAGASCKHGQVAYLWERRGRVPELPLRCAGQGGGGISPLQQHNKAALGAVKFGPWQFRMLKSPPFLSNATLIVALWFLLRFLLLL